MVYVAKDLTVDTLVITRIYMMHSYNVRFQSSFCSMRISINTNLELREEQ